METRKHCLNSQQYREAVKIIRSFSKKYENLISKMPANEIAEKIYFGKFSEGKKNRVKNGVCPKLKYTYIVYKKVWEVVKDENK
jgi:hypothetical protein